MMRVKKTRVNGSHTPDGAFSLSAHFIFNQIKYIYDLIGEKNLCVVMSNKLDLKGLLDDMRMS